MGSNQHLGRTWIDKSWETSRLQFSKTQMNGLQEKKGKDPKGEVWGCLVRAGRGEAVACSRHNVYMYDIAKG